MDPWEGAGPLSSKPTPPSFLRRAGGTGQGGDLPGTPCSGFHPPKSSRCQRLTDAFLDLPWAWPLGAAASQQCKSQGPCLHGLGRSRNHTLHAPRTQRRAWHVKEGSSERPPHLLPPPSRCRWDSEEPLLLPGLGGVPRHPGPAGPSRSFPCDPRLGTHRLWSGTAEWPWLQEAVSTNLGACVCWSHGQTPRPGSGPQGSWGPARRPPPGGMWGETGLSPAYVILGKSLPSPDRGARGPNFPTELAGQGTLCCSEDPTTPGLHRAEAAQASRRHFRL